jgi:hypothetical protein
VTAVTVGSGRYVKVPSGEGVTVARIQSHPFIVTKTGTVPSASRGGLMHINDDELATVAGVGAPDPKRQEGSISPSRERKLTFLEPLTLIVTTRPPNRLPNGGDATNEREGRYVKFDDHGETDTVSLSTFTARVNGTTTGCRQGEDAQAKAARLTGGGVHAIVSLDM